MERPKSHGYVGFYPTAVQHWGRASHTSTWAYEGGRSTLSKPAALKCVLDWVWQIHALSENISPGALKATRDAQEAQHREEFGDEYLGAPDTDLNEPKKRRRA